MFIEVGEQFPVLLDGTSLFDLSYSALVDFFMAKDAELEIEDAGFTSKKFGVAVYAPAGADDPGVACELVSVFVEGYYDGDLYDKD